MRLQERAPARRTKRCYKSPIEERIVVASPSSLALSGIEAHLNNNTLDLTMPLRQLGLPTSLQLSREVSVTFVARPNRSLIGRRHDRLELRWTPQPRGPYPSFEGTLTVLPVGAETELVLEGGYTPPLGHFGAAFDAWLGERIARATARALLQQLKTVLEREYSTVKSVLMLHPL